MHTPYDINTGWALCGLAIGYFIYGRLYSRERTTLLDAALESEVAKEFLIVEEDSRCTLHILKKVLRPTSKVVANPKETNVTVGR
jgi:hypothetical protein